VPRKSPKPVNPGEGRSGDDWYPAVNLRIGVAGCSPEQFKSKGVVLQADLDTGARGLYLGLEWALEHSIIGRQDLDTAQQSGIYFKERPPSGVVTRSYVVPLRVSIPGVMTESRSKVIPCDLVEDFQHSGFTLNHLGRKALVGRDVLRELHATLELNAENGETRAVTQDWQSFEKEVADLYRALGLTVERDVNLLGNQIDVLLRESTTSGRVLTTVVECKFFQAPTGVKQVLELAALFKFLRSTGSAGHAVLVSSSGFSKQARQAAQAAEIELLEIADLRVRVQERNFRVSTPEPSTRKPRRASSSSRRASNRAEVVPESPKQTPRASMKAFVVMPFHDATRDLYMLGIRETLASHGYVCLRGDEIQLSGRIMDKVLDSIRDSDIVVAEVTEHNPNVYYELGVAHSFNKTVVLLTRDVEHAPFDIRDLSHIIYKDIVDLKEKLTRRLISLVLPERERPTTRS